MIFSKTRISSFLHCYFWFQASCCHSACRSMDICLCHFSTCSLTLLIPLRFVNSSVSNAVWLVSLPALSRPVSTLIFHQDPHLQLARGGDLFFPLRQKPEPQSSCPSRSISPPSTVRLSFLCLFFQETCNEYTYCFMGKKSK